MGNGYQKISEDNNKGVPGEILLDDVNFPATTIITEITNQKVEISTTIQSFTEMSDIIKSLNSKYDLELLMKNCHPKAILDWYNRCLHLLWQNNDKAVILAELMPKNNRDYMWELLANRAPIHIMKIVVSKVNINAVDTNNKTFLFQMPHDKYSEYIDYLTELIIAIDNLPLNHVYNCENFLLHLCRNSHIWTDVPSHKIIRLFETLSLRKFNYNQISILSHLISYNSKYIDHYYIFMNINSYDITLDHKWLKNLLQHTNLFSPHNYLVNIIKRTDYISFLYNMYSHHIWGKEYLNLISDLMYINPSKTKMMLQYHDEDGLTVLHLMARNHDKTLLYPLLTRFDFDLDIVDIKETYRNSKF